MGRLWESAEGILYAVLPRFTDLYLAALSPDGNLAQAPGWHQARWAGDDSSGAPAAAGQYIVRLRAGRSVQEQKITLVK